MKKLRLISAAVMLITSVVQAEKELGAIWCIGDSITQSNADGDAAGSPRKSLYDLLTAAGYTFTYTGHHTANIDGLPASGSDTEHPLYYYHSGVSGIRIGEVGGDEGFATHLSTYWESGRLASVKPNIILIMLGTNDVAGPDNAPARLRKLIENIYALPGVGAPSIYLSSIPPNRRNAADEAYVVSFNAALPGIVADFQAKGKDIHFVDSFTPLNKDYAHVMQPDNLHPNAAGNAVLAQSWFNGLVATTASHGTSVSTVKVTACEWPGIPTDFYGFDQYAFSTNGLDCKVAVPAVMAEGKPWIWRARFWGHQAGPDIALLKAGYHVAYVDVANLFGSPTAVARFDAFYTFLTQSHGFDDRAVLEGMSRGGLAVYNWAVKNPDKVHCIYADAPVCDFKSWPGGLFNGEGAASSWKACLAAYGFTEEEAIAYGGNPVDNMHALATAGVPLLHVVGDADSVVPVAENTALVEARYDALGGSIKVIHKPDVGHVHGLDDSTPIVAFILNSMNE